MPKTSLSSLELAAIVQELQMVVKAKIASLQQREKEFIFQLHLPEKGKLFLRVVPGKFLCLTKKKESLATPSEFCRQLRRLVEEGILKSIRQKESERIVVMEVEKKEMYYIIVELFSRGNLILTDNDDKILLLLEQQEWKDRSLKPGEKYHFPPPTVNWKNIAEAEFAALLYHSAKRNLVTALATDLGLGGLYAEELCRVAGIEKGKLPAQLTTADGTALFLALAQFREQAQRPQGYFYEGEITPFLLHEKSPLRKTVTYNEAVDTLVPFPQVSPYEQKIAALQHTLQQQEQSIIEYERSSTENASKGGLIYERYTLLQQLLETVRQWKQQKSWGEIAGELQKLNKVRHLNLKEKTVTIDL